MQFRKAFLAALATLPLLAGGASAHGDRGGYGYGPPGGHDWREREARRARIEAERARQWAWHRHQVWEQQRFGPVRPGYPGGWGPRW